MFRNIRHDVFEIPLPKDEGLDLLPPESCVLRRRRWPVDKTYQTMLKAIPAPPELDAATLAKNRYVCIVEWEMKTCDAFGLGS